jgi:hypothetical protein
MGQNQFDYIWRNIHLWPSDVEDDVDEEVPDGADGEFESDTVNRGGEDSCDGEEEEEEEQKNMMGWT